MDKTFLTLRDLSRKLAVSEKTVYRMLRAGTIPFAIKIGGQWRFNAEKISRWIDESRNPESITGHSNERIELNDALNAGAIIYRAHGRNRDQILDEILSTLNDPALGDGCELKREILYRESIVSSTLQGIACMAPAPLPAPAVSRLFIAYLEEATDFKAIDHQPARVVLLLLSANQTERLILLTRLQRLLRDPDFVTLLHAEKNRRELQEAIVWREEQIFAQPPPCSAAEREEPG